MRMTTIKSGGTVYIYNITDYRKEIFEGLASAVHLILQLTNCSSIISDCFIRVFSLQYTSIQVTPTIQITL